MLPAVLLTGCWTKRPDGSWVMGGQQRAARPWTSGHGTSWVLGMVVVVPLALVVPPLAAGVGNVIHRMALQHAVWMAVE